MKDLVTDHQQTLEELKSTQNQVVYLKELLSNLSESLDVCHQKLRESDKKVRMVKSELELVTKNHAANNNRLEERLKKSDAVAHRKQAEMQSQIGVLKAMLNSLKTSQAALLAMQSNSSRPASPSSPKSASDTKARAASPRVHIPASPALPKPNSSEVQAGPSELSHLYSRKTAFFDNAQKLAVHFAASAPAEVLAVTSPTPTRCFPSPNLDRGAALPPTPRAKNQLAPQNANTRRGPQDARRCALLTLTMMGMCSVDNDGNWLDTETFCCLGLVLYSLRCFIFQRPRISEFLKKH